MFRHAFKVIKKISSLAYDIDQSQLQELDEKTFMEVFRTDGELFSRVYPLSGILRFAKVKPFQKLLSVRPEQDIPILLESETFALEFLAKFGRPFSEIQLLSFYSNVNDQLMTKFCSVTLKTIISERGRCCIMIKEDLLKKTRSKTKEFQENSKQLRIENILQY